MQDMQECYKYIISVLMFKNKLLNTNIWNDFRKKKRKREENKL